MSGSRDFKPTFQAERVTGKFKRTVMHIVEDVREVGPLKNKQIIARRLETIEEEFNEGYMVYFPQGHSMFIAADDTEQLLRVGVTKTPQMVDMESGEIVPNDYNLSPKEIVERKQLNRPRPAMHGGLSAIEQGEIE
jgi:hypothetical protein